MSLRCLSLRLRVQSASNGAGVGDNLFYKPRVISADRETVLQTAVSNLIADKTNNGKRVARVATMVQSSARSLLSACYVRHLRFARASRNIQRIWVGYPVRKSRDIIASHARQMLALAKEKRREEEEGAEEEEEEEVEIAESSPATVEEQRGVEVVNVPKALLSP